MAKPIKETPVLKGKDAQKFISQIKAIKNAVANPKEKERILQNFKKFQAFAKF